jgi:hypothetical protein
MLTSSSRYGTNAPGIVSGQRSTVSRKQPQSQQSSPAVFFTPPFALVPREGSRVRGREVTVNGERQSEVVQRQQGLRIHHT